jgi:uncharacterized membrane protein
VSQAISVSSAARVVSQRVQSIDVVRGLAMVVMALDHSREFWSPTLMRAEDVAQASVLLFLTRWITYFCAPTFVFLSGASIYLYQQKQPKRLVVSRFLLTRGLWLVALELGVVNLLVHWDYSLILLQVIWVIGWSMVALAGLLWLPRWLLTALTLVFLATHNLLPAIQPVTTANVGWALLHNGPFVYTPAPFPAFLVAYSIGPWLGVMLAGYLIGPWLQLPLAQRNKRLRWLGVGLLLLFVALRAPNWYGDPSPWSGQARGVAYSVLSFVNVTKYPPSLHFDCLTLGVALLLLSVAENATGRVSQGLRTYGHVPFFYYLLHLVLICGGAWLWTHATFGKSVNFSFISPKEWPAPYQPSLLRAYVVWLSVVLVLYVPCRWYQRYKQQHTDWWLSYL